ncbi:hypothetical protein H5410_044236, partial [Solanum commersonii]
MNPKNVNDSEICTEQQHLHASVRRAINAQAAAPVAGSSEELQDLARCGSKATKHAFPSLRGCEMETRVAPRGDESILGVHLTLFRKGLNLQVDNIPIAGSAGLEINFPTESHRGGIRARSNSLASSQLAARKEDKESKTLIELREVRREAQEMHDEFLRKQEDDKYALERMTQELERLRSGLGELNLWIGDKKSGMCLEDWEEKGRR